MVTTKRQSGKRRRGAGNDSTVVAVRGAVLRIESAERSERCSAQLTACGVTVYQMCETLQVVAQSSAQSW
jgi:hypothetical protein